MECLSKESPTYASAARGDNVGLRGSGFRVQDLGFRALGLHGFRFRVVGLGLVAVVGVVRSNSSYNEDIAPAPPNHSGTGQLLNVPKPIGHRGMMCLPYSKASTMALEGFYNSSTRLR